MFKSKVRPSLENRYREAARPVGRKNRRKRAQRKRGKEIPQTVGPLAKPRVATAALGEHGTPIGAPDERCGREKKLLFGEKKGGKVPEKGG